VFQVSREVEAIRASVVDEEATFGYHRYGADVGYAAKFIHLLQNPNFMSFAVIESFRIGLKLPFLEIEGNWKIDEQQRKAAWELYVELVTRVTTVELKRGEGLIREALTSYYSLFGTTRDILKKYGTAIATPSSPGDTTFAHIAVGVLNKAVRPLLALWHPILKDYEDRKPKNRSITEHEQKWEHADTMRSEIEALRQKLIAYADVLAEVSGVSKLH
jgi:hypothetical protein